VTYRIGPITRGVEGSQRPTNPPPHPINAERRRRSTGRYFQARNGLPTRASGINPSLHAVPPVHQASVSCCGTELDAALGLAARGRREGQPRPSATRTRHLTDDSAPGEWGSSGGAVTQCLLRTCCTASPSSCTRVVGIQSIDVVLYFCWISPAGWRLLTRRLRAIECATHQASQEEGGERDRQNEGHDAQGETVVACTGFVASPRFTRARATNPNTDPITPRTRASPNVTMPSPQTTPRIPRISPVIPRALRGSGLGVDGPRRPCLEDN
jgi:hypothetical protein